MTDDEKRTVSDIADSVEALAEGMIGCSCDIYENDHWVVDLKRYAEELREIDCDYKSNTYTWVIRVLPPLDFIQVRVRAKDIDEARAKAIAKMKQEEIEHADRWSEAFYEQIEKSPIMIATGQHDVDFTFISPP